MGISFTATMGIQLTISNFRLYALADGIKRFLFNPSKGLRLSPPPSEPRFVQRLLFDF
jgi:hypothetical protein